MSSPTRVARIPGSPIGLLWPSAPYHRAFCQRAAFPRQGRFVDSTGPFDDIPINGDVFPRTNNKNIANLHCLDGNGRFLPSISKVAVLGAIFMRPLRRPSCGPWKWFQGLSHRNEGRNHGGRFEVKVLHITHHEFLLRRTMRAKVRDIIQDIEAPQERYTQEPKGNKGIHVGGQMLHALETADEKGAVDEHNDESKEQLRNAQP